MRHSLWTHLTYANVMATLAAFIALGLGGTALASVVISKNSQVAQHTISGHRPPAGDHPNIIAGSITGNDVAKFSGVERCKTPLTIKLGPICAGSDSALRTWAQANQYCSGFGLRLPSISEALTMARNYDVPGVPGNNADPYFWTDEEAEIGGTLSAREVDDNGNTFFLSEDKTNVAVCVTDPAA